MADLNLRGRIYCDIPDDIARKIIKEIRSSKKPSYEKLERKCQELKHKIINNPLNY